MAKSRVAELLEKLTRIIPGIAGYQDREKRRDADRAVRERAAAAVRAGRDKLLRVSADVSRQGGMGALKSVGKIDRVSTLMERLEDELRYSPYGYAGWFDREGVALEDLERLYEYDLELLDQAESLEGLVVDEITPDPMLEWLEELEKAVDSVQRSYDDRRKALEE